MRAFRSTSACASASARCRSARSMWNASRCAVFGPTPGSRESSLISLSSGSGSCGTRASLLLQQAGWQAHAGGQRLHALRRVLLRLLERLVDRRDHEILEDLDVFGCARIDGDRHELLRTGHHRLHGAAARARLHGLGFELLLQLAHPLLHLLDLPQHLHRVFHSLTSFTLVTRPSKRRTTSRTNGSSSGLSGFAARDSAATSRSLYSTLTFGPSHSRTCGISCSDCS